MKHPVKNYKQVLYPNGDITQWFGENAALYRPWGLAGHNGIDIVRPHGEPILPICTGVVVDVKYDPKGFGKHVRVLSDIQADGTRQEWVYGHLSNISVTIGGKIKEGQEIGKMGNTGFVVSGHTPFWDNNPYAGTHLHLGLRIVVDDPKGWAYNKNTPKITVLDYDNGYKGAVDPVPYLMGETRDSLLRRILIEIIKRHRNK